MNKMKAFINIIWVFCLVFITSTVSAEVRTTPLKGTVALTFDDGPTEIYTPQILAILKKYNIKATFFMVGMNAKAHPDMVRKVFEAGHTVNSHSQTHAYLPKLNDKSLHYEIHSPKVIIYDILGTNVACLRYPY